MTNAERLFLDTNVLAYAARQDAPEHIAALRLLQLAGSRGDDLWISRQVLRELTRALLKPSAHGLHLAPALVSTIVRDCSRRYRVAEEDQRTTLRMLELIETLSLPARLVHDAHIVATMQVYQIGRLATNNSADFVPFGALISVEPLSKSGLPGLP